MINLMPKLGNIILKRISLVKVYFANRKMAVTLQQHRSTAWQNTIRGRKRGKDNNYSN